VKFKPSEALRFLGGLAAAVVVLGLIALRVTSCAPVRPPQPPAVQPPAIPAAPSASPSAYPAAPPPAEALTPCNTGPAAAARANAASLRTLSFAPFGRPETGWETYAPLIAREIHTACPPDTPGFADALAAWEGAQKLPTDGTMRVAVFNRIKTAIQMRRPFVRLSAQRVCPAAPVASALARAFPAEGYAGKAIQLRPGALVAWRQMAAAARADPAIAADPRNLTIFSGFRDPAADAARCAREGNCNGVVRATCSAHRTGLAMDLYVGQAPGFGPDSSADANRLYMSKTPAYRWLVANADRFGFVPYPFEPWHWEWTGEAP
jgi:D-alanyl-D-alanine carboxypeptidase